MYYDVPCIVMYHVLCTLCTMHRVPCTVYYKLGSMYYVLSILHQKSDQDSTRTRFLQELPSRRDQLPCVCFWKCVITSGSIAPVFELDEVCK